MIQRVLGAAFCLFAYVYFFLVTLYEIGFYANVWVPKSIDSGSEKPLSIAIGTNIGLLLLFGLQHSVMARASFKSAWTKLVHPLLERSLYVLATNLIFTLLFLFWVPIKTIVWQAEGRLALLAWGLYALGWGIVFSSSYMVNHFDLFGLKQAYCLLLNKKYEAPKFKVRFLYRFVRHPLMLGFLIVFWATPKMTLGHLIFALFMTLYTIVGIYFEEKDLVRKHGDDYVRYKGLVPALVPKWKPYEKL